MVDLPRQLMSSSASAEGLSEKLRKVERLKCGGLAKATPGLLSEQANSRDLSQLGIARRLGCPWRRRPAGACYPRPRPSSSHLLCISIPSDLAQPHTHPSHFIPSGLRERDRSSSPSTHKHSARASAFDHLLRSRLLGAVAVLRTP